MSWDELRFEYRPIGVIHSPHTDPGTTPIQPRYAQDFVGSIEIREEFAEGLDDLDGYSHIVLLYHCHRAKPLRLKIAPFLDDVPRGVFSTRYPSRPNPIGLSVVRLLRREGRTLHIADVDILDGTPLLDIKPHVARFGVDGPVRSGWQEAVEDSTAEHRGRRPDGFGP